MAMIVRLVEGEWKEDQNGCYEHVAKSQGFCLAVRLRENDDYNKVVSAVKERLGLAERDKVELTYQWPQWMMGPDWKRANPIHIENDEDVTLFMAIRADLEEVHLRVKVVNSGNKANESLQQGVETNQGLTSAEISDRHWNTAETRAVWDSALTRLLQRDDTMFYDMLVQTDSMLAGSLEIGQQHQSDARSVNPLTVERPRRLEAYGSMLGGTLEIGRHQQSDGRSVNPLTVGRSRRQEAYGGIQIFDDVAQSIGDNVFATPRRNTNPLNPRTPELTTKYIPERASATEKGKQKVDYNPNMGTPEFEIWKKNYLEEMWREMCATQMSLGGGRAETMKTNTSAKALNFGDRREAATITEENLRLTLASAVPEENPAIVTLSSDESSYGTPTTIGTMSSSSHEDEFGTSNEGDAMVPSYYSDGETHLQMEETQHESALGYGVAIFEKGSNSRDQGRSPSEEVRFIETPIPTVLRDSDAPPYFDDPWEEDYLSRAIKDADYEGDEIFVGRMFKSRGDCATKLAIHAIQRKFHFITAKSRPHIFIAVCVSDTCPWRVYATKLENSGRFEIRSVTLQHTCSVDARGDFHKQASSALIGKLMKTRYGGVGRGPRPNELRQMLRQEFSLNVSYWKAWRAREIAMDNAMGSARGSFALIQPYFKKLLETNPNSLAYLETESNNSGGERFKYLFLALHASVEGYKYMRKVVVIDGTHLRGRYGGCLIAASAQDANYQIFPIGFGIVNSENDDAWTWFLTKLKEAIPDDPELVFVSDRHSSIYISIRKVYPMASHAACVVHLKRNIVAIYKSDHLSRLVEGAARAYRLSDFNKMFDEIKAMSGPCADYLADIGFEHWTRSHFVGNRYNVMTSNIAESLNNVLTMARDYPVISILETIRTTLVTWFALRRDAAQREENRLPPKVNEMVFENFEKGAGFRVLKIADGYYEVVDNEGNGNAVNLWERTCTCRVFQLLTIPCPHAVAAAIKEGVKIETLVAVHHTVPQLRLAYKEMIMPVPDMATLAPSEDDVGGGKLGPPYVRRPPGRPPKRRIPSQGEFQRKTRRRCTRCRALGHNRTTCRGPITES